VASYAWTFGDGPAGTGVTASHTYAASGTYTVRLTVSDDQRATGTVSHDITVTVPVGPAVLARDSFDRTVTGGLGTADVGGAWTAACGASRQAVSPGVATLTLAAGGNLTGSYLESVAQTSSNVLASCSLDAAPTGGGVSVYVTGRRIALNQEYRARVRVLANGSVGLAMTRLSGSASEVVVGSEIILPGLTYKPGSALQVRVKTSGTGTTQLSATVWAAGTPEPGTPALTRSDTTSSLQTSGGLAVSAYLSSSAAAPVTVRLTSYSVTAAG
jgi:PKD repeat protein